MSSKSFTATARREAKSYPWPGMGEYGLDIPVLEAEIEIDIQEIAELLFDIEEGKYSSYKVTEKYGMAATRDYVGANVYNKEYGSYKE